MYLAIQVQTSKEHLAIKSLKQRLEVFQKENVVLHLFEKSIVKFVGRQLKEVKEKLLPGYIIAEIQGNLSDSLYTTLSQGQGVIRLLTDCFLTEEEFTRLKEKSKQVSIQIREPELPHYRRENIILNKIEKALAKNSALNISKKAIAVLQRTMSKIREKQQQYRTYIKNFAILSPYKRFTGRFYVLEFPISALMEAQKRLFGIEFGWYNPTQLALRLAYSLL